MGFALIPPQGYTSQTSLALGIERFTLGYCQTGFNPENQTHYAHVKGAVNHYAEAVTSYFPRFKDKDPSSPEGQELRGLATTLTQAANQLLEELSAIPTNPVTDRVLFMHVEQLKSSINNHLRLLKPFTE